MNVDWSKWHGFSTIGPHQFICGYCSANVGSHAGYFNNANSQCKIFICTNCGIPTLFFEGAQYPGPLLGRTIGNLPSNIETVYKEIKDCIKNSSFTSAILMGRKLLMHLAVETANAKPGETFAAYVDHLKQSGYIPPNGDKILTFIRDLGNEQNHEIKIGTKDETEKMLKFIEGLLIFMYEFPIELDSKEKIT